MFGTSAGADGGPLQAIMPILLPILMIVLFYFLILRPQQRRAKEQQALISGVKRGDTVVMSNGMIGKVTRVEDAEAMVEIAQGINVRVVKSMISDVRAKGEPVPAVDRPAPTPRIRAVKPPADPKA